MVNLPVANCILEETVAGVAPVLTPRLPEAPRRERSAFEEFTQVCKLADRHAVSRHGQEAEPNRGGEIYSPQNWPRGTYPLGGTFQTGGYPPSHQGDRHSCG